MSTKITFLAIVAAFAMTAACSTSAFAQPLVRGWNRYFTWLEFKRTPQNVIRLEGSVRAMHPDTHQLSYAMGWLVFDHRGKLVVAHGGVIDGFRVQVTLLPEEKLGFAVLSNLHETRMNQAVSNTLIDLYGGLPGRDWNEFFRPLIFLSSQTNFTLPLGLVALQGYLGTGSLSIVLAGVAISMLPR